MYISSSAFVKDFLIAYRGTLTANLIVIWARFYIK